MHTTKKEKNYKKEKSHYSDSFIETALLTPPRQHLKSTFFLRAHEEVNSRCSWMVISVLRRDMGELAVAAAEKNNRSAAA
jgi:hypothetical protein